MTDAATDSQSEKTTSRSGFGCFTLIIVFLVGTCTGGSGKERAVEEAARQARADALRDHQDELASSCPYPDLGCEVTVQVRRSY